MRSQSQNNNPIQSALIKLNNALEGTQNLDNEKQQFTIGKVSAGTQFNKFKRQRAGYSYQVGSAISKNTMKDITGTKQNFFMGRSHNQTLQMRDSKHQQSFQQSAMKLSQINYKQQQNYENQQSKKSNINQRIFMNQGKIDNFSQASGGLVFSSNQNHNKNKNNNFTTSQNQLTQQNNNLYDQRQQTQQQNNYTLNSLNQTNTSMLNHTIIPPTKFQTMKTILNLRARSRATSAYQARRIENNQVDLNKLDVKKVENCLQETEFIHKIPINYLLDLYAAKCKDSVLEYQADMATKFVEKVRHLCIKRKLNFSENQLGPCSAQILSQILEYTDYFSHLYLQKNILQNEGAMCLANSIQNNYGLIHVNLAGNNIHQEAMNVLIKSFENHPSIISICLGSKEGLNRNRIGIQGAQQLANLLKTNSQLMDLNLANCGLNVQSLTYFLEGFKYIDDSNLDRLYSEVANTTSNKRISFEEMVYLLQQMMLIPLTDQNINEFQQLFAVKGSEMKIQKFTKSDFQKLVIRATSVERGYLEILDLSHNDFSMAYCECFKHIIYTPLKKLNLSNCQIKDKNLDILSNMLKKNKTAYKISYLNLSNNGLTGVGIGRFFINVQKIDSLKEVILDDNNFNHRDFCFVSSFMGDNKNLESFSIQNCNINKEFADSISQGLQNNKNIKKLYLNTNRLYDVGTQNLGEAIGESQLQVLEIQTCQISDISAEKILNGIIKCNTLKVLNFKDNKLHDQTGKLLVQTAHLVKSLVKINISRTIISYSFIEQINQKIKQNQAINKQQQFPHEIEEMKNLQAKSEQFNEINQYKGQNYAKRLQQLYIDIEIAEQKLKEVMQYEYSESKKVEQKVEEIKNKEMKQNNQEILQNKSRNIFIETIENQITVCETKIGNSLDEIHQIEKKLNSKKTALNQKKQNYTKSYEESDQKLQLDIWMSQKQTQTPNETQNKSQLYKTQIQKIEENLEKYEETGDEKYLVLCQQQCTNQLNDENLETTINNTSVLNQSKSKNNSSTIKQKNQKKNNTDMQNSTLLQQQQIQQSQDLTLLNQSQSKQQNISVKPSSAKNRTRSANKQHRATGKKKI